MADSECLEVGAMAATRITSKGQITIPAEIRKIPGYGPGDVISVYKDLDGRIVIESVQQWISRTKGMLKPHIGQTSQLSQDEVDELVERAIAEDAMDLGDVEQGQRLTA